MPRVFISIGSNLGDRVRNCRKALEYIGGLDEILRVSSVYETEPVGNKDQPPFINCAAEIETALPPQELLKHLQEIEDKLGRIRGDRWGPRVIDIDIIFYDDLIIDSEELQIPHVSAHARRFVLEPVTEIAPGKVHPGFGVTVRELCERLEDGQPVKKVGGPSTLFPQ
ncbi:MAG TPA: 2-amino-4-hydroxy-6-hydroxymethyldihydropteridine diphosphokinase [Thermodesulfobacteriota bacterium]|jgi:2-amino-4-hydroxy-6-hydroxymethyldihydropteridine diphosphokinase|nr:2-amino-4-hydroxy-6-hydroxymethyldihydropteridine diphosphokinase [Thermodesulfobacteriota bacterium]